MRHVSRTHGVALDWLFDRIDLDPKIQIKNNDTQNQLAYMLTKGVFTCDQRSHLLRMFNHEFLDVFLQPFSFNFKRPNTMSRRAQERRTGEELVVAKRRQVSLISRSLSANQSPKLGSGTSCSQGNCRFGWNSDLTSTEKSGRDRNVNSALSSHVWHRDDNPVPSTERSGREMNLRSSTRNPGREVQNQLTEVKLNHHNVEISHSRYLEEVFAKVQQKLNRPEDDQIVLDQKVNELKWGFIMSTTMEAAIHVGQNDNLVT